MEFRRIKQFGLSLMDGDVDINGKKLDVHNDADLSKVALYLPTANAKFPENAGKLILTNISHKF